MIRDKGYLLHFQHLLDGWGWKRNRCLRCETAGMNRLIAFQCWRSLRRSGVHRCVDNKLPKDRMKPEPPSFAFWTALTAAVLVVTPAMASGVRRHVPQGVTFTCTPTQVWDGDGPVWCQEGPPIRLAGIAVRELDGSCSPSHPCPQASGIAARDALVDLLGTRGEVGRHGHILVNGSALQCRSAGDGGWRRTAAWCASPVHGDISCAMVAGGWALWWDRFASGNGC